VIGNDGESLGILPLREALQRAEDDSMDLVEISPNAEPPVCRIMDHGKYLFEQRKKQAASRKNQKQIQVKEIKFRPTTEEGDYNVKLRSILRFLEEGDKVKVTIRFRGREITYQELGMDILERLIEDVAQFAVVEQEAKSEGRQLTMLLGPKRTN
jgi:translation initiation factor IF-3